jgi:cytosine/adenosine deaminase-related metal-dependent hydrolase
LIERWHGTENGRLRYAFAPRFVLSCSEDLLARTVKEARRRGLIMHTHASENRREVEAVRSACGKDNVEYLESIGMTGSDTVLAHCVWLSDKEETVLRSTGTHVAHCPSSNLKLGSGIARVPELLALGINVALAADGAPCNNNLDGFTEMRLAALIHKVRKGPTTMPAETVLEMATLHGARALGLEDQIGSIEEGKKADLVVVKTSELHAAPQADPISMLVYSLKGSDVEHVFVDGVPRVRNGRVLGIQPRSLIERGNRFAAELPRRGRGS